MQWQSPLSYFWALEDDDDGEENIESFHSTKILDVKYEKVDINDVVNEQKYFNKSQKQKLIKVLEKYDTLFDGGLGHYTQSKIHIDLDPTVEPNHFKPYPIPNIHLPTFKKELDHLVDIGVL